MNKEADLKTLMEELQGRADGIQDCTEIIQKIISVQSES